MSGPIQFPVAKPFLPSSHHQPAETSPTMPQSPEEIIYRSYMWEGAVERIKSVMDALGLIPELSPFAKMNHGLLLAIPKVHLCHLQNEMPMLYSSGW
ncbi:hypothetical protein BGY98DRAFT_1104107 [Russula aff. rugulosa BPL654]|nr:hypothetical protein BGY98DRAFT_1104107 [Russula aff. rugulosa BPL654]